jgi:hypothetical protein
MHHLDIDLGTDHLRRLTALLDAAPDLDPGAAEARRAEAERMLYSDLDPGQRAVYDDLRRLGVLDA